MVHKSEYKNRLEIFTQKLLINQLCEYADLFKPKVYLFHLPTEISPDENFSSGFYQELKKFVDSIHPESLVCFLSNTKLSCELVNKSIEIKLHYNIWFSIKRECVIQDGSILGDSHVSLTIFSKKIQTLRHNKTLIQYTFCPACSKTTKDYGGKKHLYDPYGTLMSDVWRDIAYKSNDPSAILDRVRDLLSIHPYEAISILQLNDKDVLTKINRNNNIIAKTSLQGSSRIDSNKLLNADCLDVLCDLPDNSIDFIFADPPYNLKKKYDNWNDSLDIYEYFSWCDKWIEECARVLKPGGTFAVLNIPLYAARHYAHMKEVLDFQSWITWEALSLPVRKIMPAHYSILCFTKGKTKSFNTMNSKFNQNEANMSLKQWLCSRASCVRKRNTLNVTDREALTNLWWDIHRLKHNSKRVDHPCQLPPDLMKRLITLFTNENDIVLDPFNGAGTTTLVAEMLNRKFIGIEFSSKYHDIASERHVNLNKGIDPFAKNNDTPGAKNSRVERLKKQEYLVPKKYLQLEVKRIAEILNKRPDRNEVERHSKYPIEYYDNYFIDWGEVCGAVGNKGMSELIHH